jgi:hypothetical protein
MGAASRSTKPGGAASSSPATKQVMTLDEYMAARSGSSASNTASASAFATHKVGDTPRSSSAASSAPSATAGTGAGASRLSTVANAWSRMTSLGDPTTNSAATFPSTQSIESFPETPGRETLASSSYAPSEDYHAPTPVRVVPAIVSPAPAVAAGPSTAGTTPRAGVTPRAAAVTPTSAAGAGEFSSSLKEIIPGMLDQSKLTKAQRKNLKRAEKKAAARLEETCSVVSCATGVTTEGEDHLHLHHHQFVVHERDQDASQHVLDMNTNNYLGETPPLHPASPANGSTSSGDGGDTARGSQNSSSMSQESLECLVQHKLRKTVNLLVNLGFNYEASARSAVACGGDVHSAMQDMLVAETGAESVYPPGSETPVDISEELAAVQLLKHRYGSVLPPPALDAVIVQCSGNLDEVESRLQMQARAIQMQMQQQQQQQQMQQQQQQMQQQQQQAQLNQQDLFYSTASAGFSAAAPPRPTDTGAPARGDGLGSLFGSTFGLPDELTWSQSASQHPAACASNEWTSLLGGGGSGGGSLFETSTTTVTAASGGLGLGSTTTIQQQQHSLFGTSSGLGLGFSTTSSSSPSYQQQPQQPQQHQFQQSAPQLMPGISQQQHQQQQQQMLNSSNFSSNTVLAGAAGGGGANGGGLWGSASTIGDSFGAVSGGYYGNGSGSAGMTPPLSYDANNHNGDGGGLGGGGYLNQSASTPPPLSAGGYGMMKTNGITQSMGQYQQSYSHPQQQQQQLQYPAGGAPPAGSGGLWPQQQQQHPQQVRSSFDQMFPNTGYYANSPRNNAGAHGNGGPMMGMAVQEQQMNQDQRELQSLMGNLGLYSS